MFNTKFYNLLQENEKKHQALMYRLGIYKLPQLTLAPPYIYSPYITTIDMKSYMDKILDGHNKHCERNTSNLSTSL